MSLSMNMNKPAELLTSFESITLICIYFISASSILDLYAFLLHSALHLFLYAWNRWADAQRKNIKESKVLPVTPNLCQSDENRHEDNDKLLLFEGEVKMVMERLGVSCHVDGEKIREQVGSNEISALFDENEPSSEEVKQAFEVFDANNDGYIDAMELRKVLCALGFVNLTERVCQNMISSYDDDGDGRIDFCEFVNFLEKSFY